MSRKDDRKEEVRLVLEHARSAARSDSRHCPYIGMDKLQWEKAYRRELDQIAEESKNSLRDQINDAETVEDLKAVLLQLLDEAKI